MSLALTGAHRTGKTTLAKALCERSGMTYVPSMTSQVFSDLGLPVGVPLSVDDRLRVQERVLETHIAQVRLAGNYYVADRCPIDFAAYTLLDVAMRCDPDQEARVHAYLDRCLRLTGELFSAVVVVPPGILYVVEEGKPPPSKAYQEAMNAMCVGLLRDNRVGVKLATLARNNLRLEDRTESVLAVWKALAQQASQEVAQSSVH